MPRSISGTHARGLARLLAVVALLPAEHLGMLAEAIIDRLDAAEDTDCDDVEESDCCQAGDDDPASSRPIHGTSYDGGPGDPDDTEEDDSPGDYPYDPDMEPSGLHLPPGTFDAGPVTGPVVCCEVPF